MSSFNGLIERAREKYHGSGSSENSSSGNNSSGQYSGLIERAEKNYGGSGFNQIDRLAFDTNNFFRAVDNDNSGSKRFNAAEYFEERKKQADALKSRAASITRQIESSMDSYSLESYDAMMQYLSNFDTMVDDVLSKYKPSLDSRAGMRAYEDEYIAAMERNAQLRELDKKADFAFDPGSPSANFMQQFRNYQANEDYRAVNDNWTDEERYTLGLYQMEDPAKARDYATQVNDYYNRMATEPQRQSIRANAPKNIAGNTARALLAGFAGAGEVFDRIAENAARGRLTEKGYMTASDYAQETTGAISESLNQKYGTVDTSNFQNLYNMGQEGLRTSGVDPYYQSQTGAGILDVGTDIVNGKGVGDLYNMGYSLAQNMINRYTLGQIGGQPLVLATYFANAATSAIDDARRKGATGDQAIGMGLVKGALEVATEYVPVSELFKMGPAVTVKDFVKAIGLESLEEFVGEGLNALGGTVADRLIMGNLSEFQTAKRNYMEQGMTEEQAHAQAIKDSIANILSEGISGALSGAIAGGVESATRTAQANMAYSRVSPGVLISDAMTTNVDSPAYRQAQQMQGQLDNNQRISGNQKRILAQSTNIQMQTEAKEAAKTFQTPVETPKVSTEGKAMKISSKEALDVKDFASMSDNGATIMTNNGEVVDYDDVSFANQQQANQFYAVRSLPGLDTEAANDLLTVIQDADAGQDTDSVIGIRDAYRIGYFNQDVKALKTGDASALSPKLRQAVYDIGVRQNQAEAAVKASAVAVTTKPSEGYKKVTLEGNIKLNTSQKSQVDFIDKFSDKVSKTSVHVFESYVKNGKRYYKDSNGKEVLAPNGKYVNGEIWVDLKAGDKGEGLILNTFAHEMYHHIESQNKAGANKLASWVSKNMGIKNVDTAVEAQIRKARAAGYGEKYFRDKGMTQEQARNEVYSRAMSDFVADSLETMFTRGDPADAIAQLYKEDRTLFDQIKEFIDKFISQVKQFYSDKTISAEGAAVAQLENFQELQRLFMEAAKGAGENLGNEDTVFAEDTKNPGEQYSIRGDIVDSNGREYDRVVELEYNVFNKIKRSGKAYIDFIRNNLINKKITVYDDNGDLEVIEFAGEKERVQKDGAKNSHPVIGELTRAKNETKKLVIVNAKETAEISRISNTSNENSHQWLDKNGWEERTSHVMTKDGTVYPVTLHIAKTRDGRNILYDVNVKINEGVATDKIATSQRAKMQTEQAVRVTKPSHETVSHPDFTVNTEMNSLRNEKPLTNRQILEQLDIAKRKPWERDHLQRYQERSNLLRDEKPKLESVNARIKELSADPKQNKAELTQLKAEARALKRSVDSLSRKIREQEQSEMFKRIVTEERLRLMKETGKNAQKSYKNEQRKMVEAMNLDQRMIREMLTGTQSLMSRMEDNFIDLVKSYENKEIDRKTMRTMFVQLGQEYDQQTKDAKIWDREFSRLMKMYDELSAKYTEDTGDAKKKIERLEATIAKQRADAIERTKERAESAEVQKQRKYVEDNAKKLMKILANPTKDAHAPMALQEPLQKFLDSIDFTSKRYAAGGSATIKDRSYINALTKVRDAIKGQRTALTSEDGVYTLDVPPKFTDEIDKHIKMVSDATEGLDLTTNRIYEMTGAELKDLNYILNTINNAIRLIDRMHMQGERARNSVLANDTMQEMQRRKPIKGEQGSKFMWNNYIPFHAFRRYGKAGQKIFKGFTAGQAKLSRNVASVLEFSEKTYTAKEVREWEHTRHEIKLDSGKTVTMSPAQIMYFWCLSRRDQAIPHMQGGGMRLTTLEKFVDNAKVQGELVQKEHFTLTLGDVNRINNMLTERQIEVAQKLQQFMQNVGGKWINEISMARWDFMAATEDNYVPIMTEDTGRDVRNPDQNKSSLFALLNKSFTNAPLKNAKNALVVDSLFNVFANHMSETAEYNAFALPLIDALKWFNYRERVDIGDGHINDIGVRRSIEDTLGTEARKYFTEFLTDINSSQKAGRHEDFFGKILGRSKAASVAWNTRVAIQQISALPRASMILNYRSLILGASHFRLKKATEEMKKYSGIALWKSMGYYDLNVAKSVERQIKGDTSFLDKFNEWGMWLPGKMDERTWARIWLAAKSQVRNDTDLTGEELLQATAEKFEEVIYQTQVVDSVLTRSSFMRSKSQMVKEATSFMPEPTLAINVLMSAFQDYEEGHTTKEKVQRGLMIGFTGYALGSIANALLGSFSDAWRDDDEYETFWEKYGQALFGSKEKFFMDGNLFSELNPLEKIVFVKDILSVARGNEPQSSYAKVLSGMKNLIDVYQSAAEGKTSKTAYGVVYQTLQYLSTLSGVGISNLTREAVDVWNNTFGKWNPDKKLVRYEPNNGEELLNAIQKGTPEDIQRVFGRFENQQKAESALQHAIREKYVAGDMTEEEAQDLLTTNFDRDDEHEVYWILDSWDYARENGNSEGYLKYGKFFEAVDSGDYESEMDRLMAHGAEASDIRSQISRHYRKQYLEDETAREEIRKKLRPVYEATGMYPDDIDAKFNDWDFEAEYGMTYGEYKAEYREGNVTENELRGAMKFYGLMQYEIEADIRSLNNEIKFVDKYDMTLSEMKDAYDNGDISPNQMTSALMFDGMTQKEAKAWVKQRDIEKRLGIDYMEWDDAYKYGDISRDTFYNAMIQNGGVKQEIDDAILGYDWLKKHVKQYPDLASADGKKFAVRIHAEYAPDETLEDYGVSIDAYLEYKKLRPECKGVDANGDGKTDDGTLRDSVLRMIDSLPISNEAKDGLALMSYSKRSIRRNAPWH